MAKKNVFLHIGPALPGVPESHAALRASELLTRAGLATPKVDQVVMDRADIEIRRRHKALGLRRRDVEGAWAEVCRRAFKKARKGRDVVISQPGFVDADYQQVALALDGLVGLRLHLVLTPPTAHDEPEALAGHWAKFVRKQGRIHLLPLGSEATGDDLAAGIVRLTGIPVTHPAHAA
jgi:tetrahydromethanopterin S-methyltransferase subunit G